MFLAEPVWLLVSVFAIAPWIWERLRPRISWPSLSGFSRAPRTLAAATRWLPTLFRAIAVACLALALARPQTVAGRTYVAGQGVAIVVALDRSSSMTTRDFEGRDSQQPLSRLDAAMRTFASFVRARRDDLIGLVAFANYPDRICPPTLDHEFLVDSAESLRPARAGESNTNLGHAIVWGLEDLRLAKPRRKVLILLTDGLDNPAVAKPVAPEVAARLAGELGVVIHTIAIGKPGGIKRAERNAEGIELPVAETDGPDLARLAELARLGGGKAFVADDLPSLDRVFAEIDTLEKSPISGEIRTRYHEWYPFAIGAALSLLTLSQLLLIGRWRRLP